MLPSLVHFFLRGPVHFFKASGPGRLVCFFCLAPNRVPSGPPALSAGRIGCPLHQSPTRELPGAHAPSAGRFGHVFHQSPLANCPGRIAQKARAPHKGRTRAALVTYSIKPSPANCPPHGARIAWGACPRELPAAWRYFWRAWVKSICWSGETVIPRTFLLRP